ncbi:hypothetical protein [Chryseobacterium taichungense]|uniref:hypothetical protein n=1 Tax=Chryseobacterium taichungense TaxID=295069 RepID=UPI0028AD8E53|nr:hypothetical protein [Chryseobacterium taichungense]
MKTKILLLTALAAAIVYSCASDREDEVQNPASKLEVKKTKTINNNETSKVGDSITVQTQQTAIPPTGFDPQDPNDTEIVHPGDVKPPKP